MAFPPEFLDEIRLRLPLAEVIGRKVRLVKRGREYSGLCPFHNEKTPSFTVNEEKGFYHCFGCGAHGDVIGFVMNSEGLAFPEAVEALAGQAGLPMPERRPEEAAETARRDRILACLEAACAWFQGRLAGPSGSAAREYLEGRGLSQGTVEAFRLGYAPDERGALRRALNAQGYKDDILAEAGLVKLPDPEEGGGNSPGSQIRDYFFNRVIFPIADPRGRIIGFGGRALGESRAKYLNSPDGPLFHKGRLLYNLDKARKAAREGGELLVVEGYMDVIALAEAGFPAAVAPLGTALTEEQLGLLWRLAPEPLLCLDGDTAGQRAAQRAAERALPHLEPGRSLQFALLPAGEDPDSLVRSRGAGAFREVLQAALPLVELLWRHELEAGPLDTPERRAALRRALRQSVGRIKDQEVREAYQDEMERRFETVFRHGGRKAGAGGSGYQGRRGPWRGERPGGWQRRGPGGGWQPEREWRAGGLPDVRVPPASRQRPGLTNALRQEQVLLAAVINHPWLLQEHAEELAGLPLQSTELQRLLEALIDQAASGDLEPAPEAGSGPESQHESLDSETLRGHLCNQGFSGLLQALLQWRIYHLGPFARPDAPAAEVAAAWGPFLGDYLGRRIEAETELAGRRLAEDMSEENLARLMAVQRLGRPGE